MRIISKGRYQNKINIIKAEQENIINLKRAEKAYCNVHRNNRQKVLYTCITGGYDALRHHKYVDKDWDYVCFTDSKELLTYKQIGAWQIRSLQFHALDNVRNARWHKLHPHKILQEFAYSVWCDGNCSIQDDYIFSVAKKMIAESSLLSISSHYLRDCIYEEIEICLAEQKDARELIKKQHEELVRLSYPYHNGLHETFLIFRNHNHPSCIGIMENWWKYIRDFSRRDQLSLDLVLWQSGIKIKNIADYPLRGSKHISFYYPPTHSAPLPGTPTP